MVVLHDFAPGGAERIAVRLAGAWAAQGHRVAIASGSAEGPLRTLVDPAIAILTPPSPIARSTTRWRLGRFVASLCAPDQPADRPDIVFLPGNYYFDVAVALRLTRAPPIVVGKISNSIVRQGEKRLKAAARIALLHVKARFVRRIVLTSPAGLIQARRWLGGPAERFAVVAQPVIDSPPPPDEGPRDLCLIAAGRLEPQKNMALLLQALTLLPADIGLTILGDGSQRAALGAEAQALGIADRVAFAGYVPQIAPWLARARLFLLASDYEGFPSVLVEALAAGLPVVTTACAPAIPELVPDAQAGRIVPPRDPAAMAAAIVAMLAGPTPDRTRIAALAAPYRLDRSAAAYADLFRARLPSA